MNPLTDSYGPTGRVAQALVYREFDAPPLTSARILADSVSPAGVRLTTVEVVFHRFVLAEWNTHCRFARNSASSRAIPVERTLEAFRARPALPVAWPSEQPGMSGGAELEGDDLRDATDMWAEAYNATERAVSHYVDSHPDKAHRLHKSVINRLLEPFQYHTCITTGDQYGWAWFDKLRRSPQAQPEIQLAAVRVHEAIEASTPVEVDWGGWHLPLITDADREWAADPANQRGIAPLLPRISASRCARSSYERQHDAEPYGKTLDRAATLQSSLHMSPFEHPCRPALTNGKFVGWQQFRGDLEGDAYYKS